MLFRDLSLVAALSLAAVQAAAAQTEPAPEPAPTLPAPPAPMSNASIAFNAGVASRYVFRGVDQTNGGVQGFGGADLSYKAFYAGTWISNVDFAPFGDARTDAEADLYGGYRKELLGYALDAGFIYYGYIGQPGKVDYLEGYIKGTRAIGPVTLGVSLYLSPNFQGATGTGVYAEGNAAYALTRKITLSGALGRQSIEKIDGDYLTWNLGATYALTDKIGVDLRYWDTDQHGFGKPYGSKLVASLKAVFP